MNSKEIVQIRLPKEEKNRLDAHCKKTGRSITDVLREFIRSLPESLHRKLMPKPAKVWLFYIIQSDDENDEYISSVYSGSSPIEEIFKRHPGAPGGRWVIASIKTPPESYSHFCDRRRMDMRLELVEVKDIATQ